MKGIQKKINPPFFVSITTAQSLSNKGNNKITELRTILQRESKNS